MKRGLPVWEASLRYDARGVAAGLGLQARLLREADATRARAWEPLKWNRAARCVGVYRISTKMVEPTSGGSMPTPEGIMQ